MGLDIAELIMDVEDEFKFAIPDSGEKIKTVGELHLLILDELRKQNRNPDGAVILERLRQMIAANRNIPVEKIKSHTRFVEDLGFD